MQPVDLRSDTITQPTVSMREAMRRCKVGDDVYGEDPTIIRLEALAAERLGKETGLFVPSGTMANLVSQMTHCQRGDEMILGDQAHIFYYEQGGTAAIGGIHPRTVANQPDGTMRLEDIEHAIRPDDDHFPQTRLIAVENTHNRCNGSPLPLAYLESIQKLANRHGLNVHMDGARLFNAAVALNANIRQLAAEADSISICLSKGLAAPVGSVICGTRHFIARARRIRKVLGGGMRQAGVLAAAGIVALSEMTERLDEDHRNARRLAEGLANIKGLSVDLDLIRTNIVFFDCRDSGIEAQGLVDRLNFEGIRMLAPGPHLLRAVTHYHIRPADIDHTLEVMAQTLR